MSKILNLAEMGHGAFMERFHIELQRALENVADPNTDPKKARKITLTVTLKADENRDIATFEVQSKATLVPAKALTTQVVIDRDGSGKIVGAELRSGQKGQMFLDEDGEVKDDKGNVVNFNKPAGGCLND